MLFEAACYWLKNLHFTVNAAMELTTQYNTAVAKSQGAAWTRIGAVVKFG